MKTPSEPPGESAWEKVVIRCSSETIKGYLECHAREGLRESLGAYPEMVPAKLRIRRLGEDTIDEVPITCAKAIFYVKDFDGNPERTDIRFYRRAPIVHGVWIRLEFLNGEVMEGIVENTIRYLVDPGFFLRPTDPESNNRLVYVTKSWLKSYSVLGVRKLYDNS